MGTFSYRPLDSSKDEIRIIQIRPAVDNTTKLECSLKHVSLAEKPQYEALSYTWGSDRCTESIMLNSEVFQVTENLKQALLAFRREYHSRSFWVDAICVNQLDLHERAREIPRMWHIYQEAEQVCIWLGAASDDSGLAIDHLQQLASEWVRLQTPWCQFWSYVRWIASIVAPVIQFLLLSTIQLQESFWLHAHYVFILMLYAEQKKAYFVTQTTFYFNVGIVLYGAIKADYPQWWSSKRWLHYRKSSVSPDAQTVHALAQFFQRSWWERTWIIQELAASRRACFYCGNRQFSTAGLYNALDHILHNIYMHRGEGISPYAKSSFKTANRFSTLVDNDSLPPTWQNNLLYYLCQFSDSKAGFPKDKVYGLLGLANSQVKIVPDYRKSDEEVFIDVAKKIIISSGNLDVLSTSGNPSHTHDLPSWVPDWTIDQHSALDGIEPTRPPYSLSDQGTPEYEERFPVTFPKNSKCLRVRGVIVASLVGPPEVRITSGYAHDDWRRGWVDPLMTFAYISGSFFNLFMDYNPLFNPFCTMMAKWDPWGTRHVWQHFLNIKKLGSAGASASRKQIGLPVQFSSIYAADPMGPGHKPWCLRSWRLSTEYGSSQFVKVNDKMKVHVDEAQHEDVVAFLLGARQPYLLRRVVDHHGMPIGQSYRIVGPASFSGQLLDTTIWRDVRRIVEMGQSIYREFGFRVGDYELQDLDIV